MPILAVSALLACLVVSPSAASPAVTAGSPLHAAKGNFPASGPAPRALGGVSLNPSWSVDGVNDGGRFGASVATAGDVNGDGYSDELVASPNDPGGGHVALWLGSPAGLVATAWNPGGFDPGSRFGDVRRVRGRREQGRLRRRDHRRSRPARQSRARQSMGRRRGLHLLRIGLRASRLRVGAVDRRRLRARSRAGFRARGLECRRHGQRRLRRGRGRRAGLPGARAWPWSSAAR